MDFSLISQVAATALLLLRHADCITLHPRPTYYHVVVWEGIDKRKEMAMKANGKPHWF